MTREEACNKFYKVIVKYCYYRTSKNMSDAEDVAGDVFLKLGKEWNSMDSHEENRGLAWLHSVADYKIQELYRKNYKNQNMTIPLHTREGDDYELPDESVDGYEENRKYENYISQIKERLTEEEWRLFELSAINQKAYKEIGEILQISEAAVKMRRQRLNLKLKPILIKLFHG